MSDIMTSILTDKHMRGTEAVSQEMMQKAEIAAPWANAADQ